MKKRKVLIIVVIIAVAAVLALGYFTNKGKTDENSAASLYVPEEPAIAVEAFLADYSTVIPSVDASGLIKGKNEAVIVSETRGLIKEVSAQIGTFLKKGDPVLSVESSVAELSMFQAEQQLKSIEIDYNAVKKAHEAGSASEIELVRSRGQLSGAEAAYEAAVKNFENTVVKVPFDGFLADMEDGIGEGNYISEGVRIGKVVDISSVKVNLFLGDVEIQKINKGTKAVIKTGSKILEGQVEAIALSSDKSTGSFRVVISAENPYGEEIRSGFAADVAIDLSETSSEIIIPASAVFEIGSESLVYVIEDNTAILRKVETGVISGNRIEIISGLDKGEAVVTTGFRNLKDKAKVIPQFPDSAEETE